MRDGVLVPYLFNGKSVRVFRYKGDVWFVANDVGKALGMRNVRTLLNRILLPNEHIHVSRFFDKNAGVWIVDTTDFETLVTNHCKQEGLVTNHCKQEGHCTKLAAINKSGLYTLIMRSSKSEALKFRNWVTSDVLPSIMETGHYDLAGHSRLISSNEVSVDLSCCEVEQKTDSQKVLVKIGSSMSLYIPMTESGYRLVKELCAMYKNM